MNITSQHIHRRLTGWSEDEWDNTRAHYAEYQAAYGPDATKTFSEFAWGIAAQNELYAQLTESK